MHDNDVKIDGGNLPMLLVRQPHTLPGHSSATCQEQDTLEWGVQEHEACGSDAVSDVREISTRVAMCRNAGDTTI
jgi:hypothetical protein